MKKVLLVSLIIVALICALFVLTACELKIGKEETKEETKEELEVPFAEEHNIEFSDINEPFEIPLYTYAVSEGNPVEFEGVEFAPQTMKYRFDDWEVSEPDENGNVTITFNTYTNGGVDIKVTKPVKQEWSYTYFYLYTGFADYYTGELLPENVVNIKGNSNILENGIEEKDKEEFANTEISFNNKTTNIGLLKQISSNGWGGLQTEKEDGATRYKDNFTMMFTQKIIVPKDYDGILLIMRKEGATKERYERSKKEQEKYIALQKEAEKTGEKSQELIDLENEKAEKGNLIENIIKGEEKKGNEIAAEDININDYYYVFRISDAFKDNNESN